MSQEQNSILQKEISFAEFRRETRHKKVEYTWTAQNKTKTWTADKFYCNAEKHAYYTNKFIMSREQKFFKIDETTFKAVSDHGETVFKVLK